MGKIDFAVRVKRESKTQAIQHTRTLASRVSVLRKPRPVRLGRRAPGAGGANRSRRKRLYRRARSSGRSRSRQKLGDGTGRNLGLNLRAVANQGAETSPGASSEGGEPSGTSRAHRSSAVDTRGPKRSPGSDRARSACPTGPANQAFALVFGLRRRRVGDATAEAPVAWSSFCRFL